ncbi:GNAT family N-acetyltransferase [Saccharopolyspora rosea]|uniref:GNAT family N-acetyltransferase n=1 Tax=Saccharopolyspora rosea TaxID=524884 RepID=A0ABW3FZU1_9PSEU
MEIVVDDLSGPEVAEFLDEHVREMRAVTPDGSKHALDLAGLREPGITVWTVRDGPAVVGCGALRLLDGRHGEVKAMRTAAQRKRSGIASLLLERIITEAVAAGLNRLSLETGAAEFFRPARKLYERFGFVRCGPFGDYRSDPNSVFMTKLLRGHSPI